MDNIEQWQRTQSIAEKVDDMYEKSDEIVFEILMRIADLAIQNTDIALSSNGRMPASEAVNVRSSRTEAAKCEQN